MIWLVVFTYTVTVVSLTLTGVHVCKTLRDLKRETEKLGKLT